MIDGPAVLPDPMARPLRALLVDDSEEDAFLLLRHLRKNDYDVASERVDTADGLRAALARGPWDIALCDYVMPLLSGEEALRILAEEAPDLPVITVSGNVGEEFAVAVMRAGAKDYVRKDSLSRLIPAIERELADAVERRERRVLEDRLREAEVRAETLFATMEQGVVYRDTSGRIIATNPAAMRIFGLTMDQMQGRAPLDPHWRLVREDGSPFPIEEHPAMTSLRTRQPTRGVVVGVETDRDDERRWMLIDAVPEFRPGEDAPYRVFSTFTDITASKKAEAAVRASQAEFNEMVEALPLVVWVLGSDGTLRYANGRWVEYTGIPEGSDHDGDWLQTVHPDDRDLLPPMWPAGSDSPCRITWRLRRHDGEYRWFESSATPVRDALGTIVRWIGVDIDVDDQKRLEEEVRRINEGLEVRVAESDERLRESEERMTLAFRASEDGIWDWQVGGETWYSDRWSEMLGYAPGELRADMATWQDALHPDDRGWVNEAVDEVLRGDRPYDLEFRIRHKDGHYLTVQSRGFPVRREPGGPVVRMVGIHHDVTDQKRAEAALRSAVDDLESFNYSVSHDLRAPLRHIGGFTAIIEEEYGGQLPDEVRRYVAKVHAGSERMAGMIDALLKLSRVGRAAPERRSTDVAAMARTVWAELSSAPGSGQAELVVRELPEVDADPELLRQVLENLLGNALKFTRPVAGPRVEVGVGRSDDEAVIFVRDNGVGFDSKGADRLFSVFRRLHADDEFEGAGIGLSIVKRIIEKHGGRVWAESAPGRGATFFFALPARAEASPQPGAGTSKQESPVA